MTVGPAIVRAIAAGQHALITALEQLDDRGLRAPTLLPDWDRLTVVCHLRYGAEAVGRMVADALAGRPTLYYPGGRLEQRPGTLRPRADESARDVVVSFAQHCEDLDARLAELAPRDFSVEVVEPADTFDIGTQTIEQLLTLRLTEVEVHGGDLLLGLDTWSPTLVAAGLPLRFERLANRLANQPPIDFSYEGTWLLRTTDGDAWTVTVEPRRAEVRLADYDTRSDATITASRRDMLALLLGRPLETEAVYSGDVELAAAFSKAFPGP